MMGPGLCSAKPPLQGGRRTRRTWRRGRRTPAPAGRWGRPPSPRRGRWAPGRRPSAAPSPTCGRCCSLASPSWRRWVSHHLNMHNRLCVLPQLVVHRPAVISQRIVSGGVQCCSCHPAHGEVAPSSIFRTTVHICLCIHQVGQSTCLRCAGGALATNINAQRRRTAAEWRWHKPRHGVHPGHDAVADHGLGAALHLGGHHRQGGPALWPAAR